MKIYPFAIFRDLCQGVETVLMKELQIMSRILMIDLLGQELHFLLFLIC